MEGFTVRSWIQEQATQGRLFFTREEILKALPDTSKQTVAVGLLRARETRLISIAWQGFYLILPPAYVKQGTIACHHVFGRIDEVFGTFLLCALLKAAALRSRSSEIPTLCS